MSTAYIAKTIVGIQFVLPCRRINVSVPVFNRYSGVREGFETHSALAYTWRGVDYMTDPFGESGEPVGLEKAMLERYPLPLIIHKNGSWREKIVIGIELPEESSLDDIRNAFIKVVEAMPVEERAMVRMHAYLQTF